MATVIQNTKGSGSVVTATSTDGEITLAELKATGDETWTKATITEVFWTVNGTNTWLIDRGGTALAQFSGSGHHDYKGSGAALVTGSGSDIGLTLSGGTGFIMLIIHKQV